MKSINLGSSIAIAAGVGTAVGVSSHNTVVGFGVGIVIAILFALFNKEK